MVFNDSFNNYIMAVSFIEGGKRSTLNNVNEVYLE
jgi:hypothetical protein